VRLGMGHCFLKLGNVDKARGVASYPKFRLHNSKLCRSKNEIGADYFRIFFSQRDENDPSFRFCCVLYLSPLGILNLFSHSTVPKDILKGTVSRDGFGL
jgi:hypothetical protein